MKDKIGKLSDFVAAAAQATKDKEKELDKNEAQKKKDVEKDKKLKEKKKEIKEEEDNLQQAVDDEFGFVTVEDSRSKQVRGQRQNKP